MFRLVTFLDARKDLSRPVINLPTAGTLTGPAHGRAEVITGSAGTRQATFRPQAAGPTGTGMPWVSNSWPAPGLQWLARPMIARAPMPSPRREDERVRLRARPDPGRRRPLAAGLHPLGLDPGRDALLSVP